jgi:hypothetical protein
MSHRTVAGIIFAVFVTVALETTVSGCAVMQAPLSSTTPTANRATASPSTPGDNSTSQSQPTHPLTATDAAAATTTADTAMRLYARPTIDAGAWIAALDPFLTQNAAATLDGTDPTSIPADSLTGPASVSPASTAEGALVSVPTNAGTYQLLLLRDASGWLIDTITPPRN